MRAVMTDPTANPARAMVILVVEDEWLLREGIADYLQDAGCVVIQAETAERAIDICRSDTPVDILFTDIRLDGSGTGWEVAEAFRDARGDAPVIYASGNPVEPARCVSGSVYFDKPYRPADILRACARLVGASAAS
jgi:two-component system, response regulator PdtaR